TGAGEAPATTAHELATAPEATGAEAHANAAVAADPAPAAPAAPAPVATTPRPSTDTQDRPAAAPGKPGWRERLRGSGFSRGLGGLFSRNPKLDDDLLDEIETALITADVGVTATTGLVEHLRRRMKAREFADA